MAKKRVLVTGGAGFVGSHLCDRLLQQGNFVICLDNFFTGSKQNISPFLEHPDFELISDTVCSPFSVEVEEIYNLACPASPIHYQCDPVQTVRTNILGMLNVLELAHTLKARVFQASTSEVYGDPEVHPQVESYWGHVNPIGYRSCYDEGKRCAETLCFDYFRQYGLPVKVGRIFNTYGPRMHPNDGRVVSNFIVQALMNQPITIYGKGEQTRSFCYVDDLVEGIITFMGTPSSFPGPMNLGNPEEFQIIELAKMVIDLTGSKSELVFNPLPSDDPRKRRPDISLAEQTMGWRPKISLKEGLLATIAYFEKSLSIF